MSSLSPERLAALVDEVPTPDEQAQLDASPALRAELAALRRVVALAAYDRAHPGTPLTSWGSLSAALRDDGLATSRRLSPSVGAAVVPGGAAADVTVRAIGSAPSPTAAPALDGVGEVSPVLDATGPSTARAVPSGTRAGAAASGGALPGALAVGARITDREQAVRTLQQLEEAHQQAVGWLAANDSSVGTSRRIVSAETMVRDLRRQIEVLDAAVAMGRRALYESPDDPVMNRYYFSALAAREVLLRRLAAALPAGQQVLEY
ncbi:MAG: hypothetical protein MUF53_13465 [Gemmatimonadaceae bacterium]|nr:hypothetical protein [Gemmatimonadaceae bacterium]